MIPNDRTFGGKSTFEYEGHTYQRWYYVEKCGEYRLHFKIVSTNSPYRQGIALFFGDFKGSLELNGQKIAVLKGFKHYVFHENYFENNEFTLSVSAKEGKLIFANSSDDPETGAAKCGAYCCAFWIEQLSETRFRFHCNDHESDDDFDDLVFDLEYCTKE